MAGYHLGLLQDIAKRMKREKCEHLIKYSGQEISFAGLGLEVANSKVSLANVSNKIIQLIPASSIVQTFDNNQYMLCKEASKPTCPEKLRDFRLEVRILHILAFSQLHALLSIPKPTQALKKEIEDWVKHMNKITKTATNILLKDACNSFSTLTTSSSYNTIEDLTPEFIESNSLIIKEILTTQNIDEKDLEEAVNILKQPFEDD